MKYFILLMALFLAKNAIYTQIPLPEIAHEVKFVDHKFIPSYAFKKFGNSTIFQGNNKRKKYFEGWYFKMVGESGKCIMSVIPGISLSKDGKQQHAFIQIINGLTAETRYYTFPIESFSFSKKDFQIKIDQNYFSKEKIILNIEQGSDVVSGEVLMANVTNYSERKLLKREIMGWYRKVPVMECYHGVVSLTHNLTGQITINNEPQDFDLGKGYIEKDWGSSMPSSWIWLQSNNFQNSEGSFMISIADVPFAGKSFTGFLGFFYYKDEVYRFGTYRNSDITLDVLDSNNIKINIANPKETIEIRATKNKSGELKAPLEGNMDRRIDESIDAEIEIKLFDKKGNLLYSDRSNIAGLELVGAFDKLSAKLK